MQLGMIGLGRMGALNTVCSDEDYGYVGRVVVSHSSVMMPRRIFVIETSQKVSRAPN